MRNRKLGEASIEAMATESPSSKEPPRFRAPARSVSENLAGIVGGFRRLRSSEGRRESMILLGVSDDDFVIAGRHSQTKVPVVRPPLEARLLDVDLHPKGLSQFSVEPQIH